MTAPRIHVVDGPPGCGKTTYLARQSRRATELHGASAVAIASLTRTAATEIGGRDTNVPTENIGTLHAHCYRALDRPDLAETNKSIREFNAAHPAHAISAQGIDLDDGGEAPAGDNAVHEQVTIHRARMTPREQWTDQQIEHHDLWTGFKRETGRLDFTDLIERCINDRQPHPAHPRVLLLDEAQDFSRLEMQLAMQWAQHTDTTVLVGDPRQAIFEWRGADPDALLRIDATDRRILEQSYRVPHAAHAVAQHITKHLPIGPAAYQPRDHDGHVEHAQGMHLRSTDLADRLADDHASGRDAMVLASCGYMLGSLTRELRQRGIPFHNPHRASHGAWNPMRGAGRLAAFLRPSSDVWGDAARAWTWDDLRRWTEPMQARGVLARGAKALIASKCEADRFGESDAGREVPLDMLMTAVLGTENFHHPALRMNVDWWEENLRATAAAPAAYPLDVYRRSGGRALVDTPRIVLGTIHSVKGAQSSDDDNGQSVVYLAPDLSAQGADDWGRAGAERDAIIRMLYVGATRARHDLVVLAPTGPEHAPASLFGADEVSRVRARARARGADLEARIAARIGARAA